MRGDKSRLLEDLKSQILTMKLDPGEDLDEAAISKAYGLSRTPVREVFRLLAGEGYVTIRENKGVRVAPMDYLTLRNFFLVAPMIYAAVGRLAVHNYKPKQLADLKATQQRFRAASEARDGHAMALANNRFHELVGEMSGNAYLQPSLSRLLIDHARIGHTFFRPHNDDMARRMALAVEHHDRFIDSIVAHDEEAMVELVSEHWALSRENMEMFIAPAKLEPSAFDDFAAKTSMESPS